MLRSLFRSACWPVPVLSEKPFTDEGKRLFPNEQSENPHATCHLKKGNERNEKHTRCRKPSWFILTHRRAIYIYIYILVDKLRKFGTVGSFVEVHSMYDKSVFREFRQGPLNGGKMGT